MATLAIEMPEKVFAAMRIDPDEFANQMRLAAAVSWYEQRLISQEVAAKVAGLSRLEFLLTLARLGKNSFAVDFHDLDRELRRG